MKRNSLVVLTVFLLLVCSATASVASGTVKVSDKDTVADVLKHNVGKSVEVVLVSGERLAGKVETVAATVVHISGLKGMEFYDAVVRIEDVSAVIIRARG